MITLSSFQLKAQTSFFEASDSLNNNRFIGTSIGIGAAWSGSMIYLNEIWYSKVEKSPWNTFDDSGNWLQMDKAGHFYTAYQLNRFVTDMYRWSGVKQQKALWFGAGVSLGFQTTLELLDGFTEEWGWSWSDFTANTLGAGFYTGQELIWKEQRLLPKFSYFPTEFAEVRPETLGSNFAESLLKDYNGQTYWLSFSPSTFFKNSPIPKWACLSFGYSVHEKLVGSEPTYVDPITGITYNEQREFLFSLDIDFSRIPVKKPWAKALLKQLNYLKIPFPALIVRDGRLIASPLYF